MKTTIKTSLALLFGLACIASSYSATDNSTNQNTTDNRANVAPDGFSVRNQQVMITQNGQTKMMTDDMKLADGLEIRTDGTVIVPGGTRKVLREGDTMTFDGTITRANTGKVEQLHPSN